MTCHPSAERHAELLARYCVPGMGDLSVVGSLLSTILERLDTSRALSPEEKQYLRDKGLFGLCDFVERLEATGKADYGTLRGPVERRDRLREERRLRRQYGIGHFERHDKWRLMKILRQVDRGGRLTDDDVLWLSERELFSDALRCAFHEHEAKHHLARFDEGGDPWEAVNASSHFRKAGSPSDALAVLGRVALDSCGDAHLRSAVCATQGGALRDLGRLHEAVASAERAHGFDPRSFHPCTLLGALHYELDQRAEGGAWFAKAVERGAKPESIDHELRSILRRATGTHREQMKRHLLALDPERYQWVRDVDQGRNGARGHRPRGRT